MLFIVFVENAFKHLGVLKNDKSKVCVSIDLKNDSLVFKCENTIDREAAKGEDLEKGKSGIGLKNAEETTQSNVP